MRIPKCIHTSSKHPYIDSTRHSAIVKLQLPNEHLLLDADAVPPCSALPGLLSSTSLATHFAARIIGLQA